MPRKRSNSGTTQVSTSRCYGSYRFVNGTTSHYVRGADLTFSRRIGRSSTIVYSNGTDGRFRECEHNQTEWICRGVPNGTQTCVFPKTVLGSNYHSGLLSNVGENAHRLGYSAFTTKVEDLPNALPVIDWGALAAEALQTMLPSFGGKNSIINFVYELKDFKGTASKAFKRFRHGDTSVSWLEILLGMKKDKKLNRLRPLSFRNLSRAHLSTQFGWLPLYSDMASLYKSMVGLQAQYTEYTARANRIQQRYYGRWVAGTEEEVGTLSSAIYGPPGGYSGPFLPEGRTRVRRMASKGIRYTAVMRYRYPLPKAMRDASGRNKALLDSIGFSGNFSTIWNIVPWTFVVDWFVNVSRYLDRLRVDNIQFQTEILDFCHSARVQRGITYEIGQTNDDAPATGYVYPNRRTLFSGYSISDTAIKTNYMRKVGIPNLFGAITTSGLSLREFSLGGALIGVKTRRR